MSLERNPERAATPPGGCWGKWDAATGLAHPLEDHCLDVAAVTRALLDHSPSSVFASLDDIEKERLAAVAFLHDLGKCNWGFQAKADATAKQTAGHVLEAMGFLELQDRWPDEFTRIAEAMCGWFGDTESALQMLVAAISHHGRPVSYDDFGLVAADIGRYWQARGARDPMEGVAQLASLLPKAYPNAFGKSSRAIRADAAFQQRFAGLVMLADWIGSDTQFFPYRRDAEEDRPGFARAAAMRALSSIGLATPAPAVAKPFRSIFGFAPSNLQRALAQTIPTDEETRLVLVESDTGSGKTEAALAWFFRLYAEAKVQGLYFALPTRVAARELYERVCKAMRYAFDEESRPGPVLLAVPGYVKVDGFPMLPDSVTNRWDDDRGSVGRERLWAAERPKRFLAAPVAVGTIDQALLSVLQVKHSLLRSVCLDRHLLVVDEVHASDTYMRELLLRLLKGHCGRGGRALLLSATLGEAAACTFFQRPIATLEQASARPYPLLTTSKSVQPFATGRPSKRVSIELSPTLLEPGALLARVAGALRQRARVLIVCNTVRRANALLRAFEAIDESFRAMLFSVNGVASPHHGRFAREDREAMDAAVSERLGKGSANGPLLLVGTQTLEQSLDIDADWLISDLCPMDVLLQRIGRLHRHSRERPAAFESPSVLVQVPAHESLSAYVGRDGKLNGPAGLSDYVYADGRILQRTWDVLRTTPVFSIPDDNRRLIEMTTHPEALDALGDPWRRHAGWLNGQAMAEIRAASTAVLEELPFGELHYPDKAERIATRLGAGALDIPFDAPVTSPFGNQLQRMTIPGHLVRPGVGADSSITALLHPEGLRFVLSRSFRYTRFGLEIDDVQLAG